MFHFLYQDLINELKKLHETFNTAEQAGKWVIEHSPDNLTTIARVCDELESLQKEMDDTNGQLLDLHRLYQATGLDNKPLSVILDDFANMLAAIDKKISRAKKLSVLQPTLLKQNDRFKVRKRYQKVIFVCLFVNVAY